MRRTCSAQQGDTGKAMLFARIMQQKLGLRARAGRTAYWMCTQFALSSLPFPTCTMSPHLANSRMTSCSWLGWKPNTVTHTLSSAGGPARPLTGSQNPDCSLTPLGSGWTVVPGAAAGPGMRTPW